MCELLGRHDCIESLRKDLVDIQEAILDVFSRTGPVGFCSWKFPDKLSCNLDMFSLLEQYDYTDGEDAFNQHSHIVLLELVIDRLLLLLQSFNAFVEQLRSSHRRSITQQKRCVSVGLVVRSCWTNLVHFANFKDTFSDSGKQTKSQILNHDETETESPGSLQKSVTGFSRHCVPAWSSASSLKSGPQSHESFSPAPNTPSYPVVYRRTVSCQTVESSLIPCDACHQVQSILKQTGDALVDLFQSEGLPSSMQPLLKAVDETLEMGHLTAGDVAQWAIEQLKDIRRLKKHLQDVRGTVKPLKEQLAAAETDRERFRSQLVQAQKEFKEVLEKHQVNIVQLEFSLRKAERAMKETERRLHEEQQQHKRKTLSLEESNAKLKDEVMSQKDSLQVLECEKVELQEKVKTMQSKEEASCALQQRIHDLQSQISDSQLLLHKENVKYQSAHRQQESMQSKQRSLLKRVDTLDEECEELQRQLGEKEEQHINLQNQLHEVSAEKEQLQTHLTQQQELCSEAQKEKETFQARVHELETSVKGLRERERLLVAFPELTPQAYAQPQSTGDVILDMEQQLQANSIRIKILELENATLLKSLEKLRKRVQHNAGEPSPKLAWSISPSSTLVEIQQNPLNQISQSNSAARQGYSDRGEEARGGGRSDRKSAGSLARVSDPPSSLQLHLQSLHLNVDSSTAQRNAKLPGAFLLSHPRGLNKRRK